MAGAPARLEIAKVGRPHGLRGEVHLWPITDREERFVPGAVAFIDERSVTIASARRQVDHWLVRFDGVDDRNAAQALNGAVLTAEPLGALPEGEYWVHELVGSQVTDQRGIARGIVEAVQANPAHDLLVLEGGALVPMVFVRDVRDGVITVEVPDGLFDEEPTDAG